MHSHPVVNTHLSWAQLPHTPSTHPKGLIHLHQTTGHIHVTLTVNLAGDQLL